MMNIIRDNLSQLQQQISQVQASCNRHRESILLLAVSKGQSADKIRQAWQLGLRDFGENYLQEALQKQAQLQDLPISWHFIGPIQSNKCQSIATHFNWVQSVSREKIAALLNRFRLAHLPPLQICLQVNLTGEASKSGCSVEALRPLIDAVMKLPRLQLRGLMYIPPVLHNKQQQLDLFLQIQSLMETLNQAFNLRMDTLSMGMSDDLPIAIAAGSTLLRIGRALFGERQ